MKENNEINEHIQALGEWASQDKERVAFVVCGEITEDGVKTSNSLVGRTDKIARAIFGNAMESNDYKKIIELTAAMINNPLLAAILSSEPAKENSFDKRREVAASLIELLDALKEKISKS